MKSLDFGVLKSTFLNASQTCNDKLTLPPPLKLTTLLSAAEAIINKFKKKKGGGGGNLTVDSGTNLTGDRKHNLLFRGKTK